MTLILFNVFAAGFVAGAILGGCIAAVGLLWFLGGRS